MGDLNTAVTARPTPLERRRLPWREEMITCLLGTWLLAGLHLDGWAHRNLNLHDSIATPWHAVLYSGWGATAGWIIYLVLREANQGKRGLAAIPRGYGLGVAGVVSFAVGGAADQVWHLFLGVEQDIQAFLSPTHWLLAIGMGLMVSCSLRAGWTSFDTARPSFRQFAPTLWSITLTTAMIGFAYNYLSLFVMDNATIKDRDLYKLFRPEVPQAVKFAFAERLRMQGVGDEIVWTVLLMGISLLVLRRWRPPFGSYIILFGVTTTAVNAVWNFDHRWSIVAGVVGGITADVLVLLLDPRADRPLQFRIFAAVVPTVMWAAYFVTIAIAYGMGWTTPMWAGAVTFAAPIGVLISALIVPMSIPVPSEELRAGNGLHPNGDRAAAVVGTPLDETVAAGIGPRRNGRETAKAAPASAAVTVDPVPPAAPTEPTPAAEPANAPSAPARRRTRPTAPVGAAGPANRDGSTPGADAAVDGGRPASTRPRRPRPRTAAVVGTEAAATGAQPAEDAAAPAAPKRRAPAKRAPAKRAAAVRAETAAPDAPSAASLKRPLVPPTPAAGRTPRRPPAATGKARATPTAPPATPAAARRPRKTPQPQSNGVPDVRDLERRVT